MNQINNKNNNCRKTPIILKKLSQKIPSQIILFYYKKSIRHYKTKKNNK